jgi:hypothetical protein
MELETWMWIVWAVSIIAVAMIVGETSYKAGYKKGVLEEHEDSHRQGQSR